MKNKSKLLRFVIRFLPFICASIFLVSCSKSCDMDTLVVTNEAEYPVHVSINMGSTSYTAVLNTGGAVRKDYSWTDTATITATRADAWLTEARAKRSYWETELSTVPPSVDVETILASIKEWDEKIKAYERESHTASATCAPKGGSNGNAEGAYEHYTIPVRVSTVDGNLKVTCETPSLQF